MEPIRPATHKKVYLSGPMTGYTDYNYPAFQDAEDKLKQKGFTNICNPIHNFEGRIDMPRHEYMRVDLSNVLRCDAVVVLPGWEDSIGARAEVLIAQEIDIPVVELDTLLPVSVKVVTSTPTSTFIAIASKTVTKAPTPPSNAVPANESILAEAERLVGGDRKRDYAHPFLNFARIADLWSSRFGVEFSALDVADAQILVKMARQQATPKRDNLVDIAGYALCAQMIAEYEDEQK
jgi:hypothetical protein